MTSSSSPSGSVEAALQAADKAIRREAEKLSSAETSSGQLDACKQMAAHNDITGNNDAADQTDPDDLAAAFFAAQAKKQEAENRLPIKEWTQLFPDLRLQSSSSGSGGGGGNNLLERLSTNDDGTVKMETDSHPDTVAAVREMIKERLVQSLYQDYIEASAGVGGSSSSQ